MSGVRRRGYLAAALALVGAAAITALLSGAPKPVDVRLVAPPPAQPETVSATATTTMSAVGAAVTTTPPPPQTPVVAPAPPKPVQTTSSAPSSSRPRGIGDLLRCDYRYLDDDFERCLPWPLSPPELCQWIEDHDLIEIEVRGRDGRGLDFDCDD